MAWFRLVIVAFLLVVGKPTGADDAHGCGTSGGPERRRPTIQVGAGGEVVIWKSGTVINCYFDRASCVSRGYTESELGVMLKAWTDAAGAWNDRFAHVKFKVRVSRRSFRNFARKDLTLRCVDLDDGYWMYSLFPKEHQAGIPSTIQVRKEGRFLFNGENGYRVARVMEHELGHFLGLRHEFANQSEDAAVGFGADNAESIMGYNWDTSMIQNSDIDGLNDVYTYRWPCYKNWRIVRKDIISGTEEPVDNSLCGGRIGRLFLRGRCRC
jgi:hypothetical protein